MAKKKEVRQFMLSIAGMQEVSFKFNTEYDYSTLNADNLSFGIKYNVSPNKENEIVRFTVSIVYEASDRKERLAEHSLMMEFHIIGLAELITTGDNGEDVIDKSAAISLLNISIGTLRGAFFMRMKDTPLSKYPLPLISDQLLERELDVANKQISKEEK